MSAPDASVGEFSALREIDIDQIDPNPENPRLIFPEEELDRLAESIANEGILVPIVVYPEGDRFVLIDGERRFLCAQRLALEKVPAVITAHKSPRENLVQMFNIHLVREPWRDMPTAYALGKLIDALTDDSETKTPPTDNELSDITGLSKERISRLRHALDLPEEYQRYILEGEIPLNWFWELRKNVVLPLAKQRPAIFERYGAEGLLDAFVTKRLDGAIRDTVSLRDVRPIINFAQRDADGSGEGTSVLDATLISLIEDPEQTIDDAYQDTVQIMVEADKLERRTDNMLKSFERLLSRVRNADERAHVVQIGESLIDSLRRLLD
jgi:ParB/RepB/Spo0J family partition protein